MINKYDVVLLLGGTGSRMPNKPENKHLVDVNGKTMVEHAKDKISQLEEIVNVDSKYAIVNNYGTNKIMKILGNDWKYVYQEKPTGIIDAVKLAKPENSTLIYLGDQYFQDHLGSFVEGFNYSTEDVRVWYKESTEAKNHTTMFTRDNWIYKFREKPEVSEGKLVTGLYLLKPKLYELSNNLPRNEKGENNMADFLNVINNSAYRQVDARRMKGYWYDIGTPEILNKANDIKYGSKS